MILSHLIPYPLRLTTYAFVPMKRIYILVWCLLCMQHIASAQLCSGSLGDPLVNITFGANSAGPLKPGVTNLLYTAGSCPNDGEYTIASSVTVNCFNNSWYTIAADHTGNKGGQFMLVNASITPNDFYVDTVSGLCGNTTFEFAAWVANVLRASACSGAGTKPNLTFRIETTTGSVLVRYDTGDIPAVGAIQWSQFGTFFTTPVGVNTVVLRITNNAPGGCGNDLALDDITFRPCGPTLTTTPRIQVAGVTAVCQKDLNPVFMDLTSTGSLTGSIVQWQVSTDSGTVWTNVTGANGSSCFLQPNVAGVFEYRVLSAETANFASVQCRVASNISTITVYPLPVLPKTVLPGCTNAPVTLPAATGNGYTYQWTGPNNFSSTAATPVLTNISYTDSGTYRAFVKTPQGCSGNDTIVLKVFPGVTASVNGVSGVCAGSSALLQASGGTIYSWSPARGLSDPNSADPLASPADTTLYTVTVANTYGCKDSAKTTLNVYTVPVVNAGTDKKIFEGQSVSLEGSITGSYQSFYWLPITAMANANTLTPTVTPSDSVTYTLYAVPAQACPASSDNVFIRVYKNISIPNAFSPNGDGINDTWIIKGLETYPGSLVRVYDRKGILLFQSHSANPWDGIYNGRPLPLDTYYYVVDLNIGVGPLSGWVVILR